jgi:ubiquinone/menaquinone biosynthesis C-methylase UbiE
MWAVLTYSSSWDAEEFFATGEAEIEALMSELESAGVTVRPEAALDFGCGVGRLTRALSKRFETVTGLDIAPSMLEEAQRQNEDLDNCRWALNREADLGLFEDACFDLAYSNITLQHGPPALARRYIAELVRVLRPGGVLVFQLPDAPARSLRRGLRSLITRVRGHMAMYGMDRSEVVGLLEGAGAEVVLVRPDDAGGPGWPGFRYVAIRR